MIEKKSYTQCLNHRVGGKFDMEIYGNIDDIVILISVIFDKNYENLQ